MSSPPKQFLIHIRRRRLFPACDLVTPVYLLTKHTHLLLPLKTEVEITRPDDFKILTFIIGDDVVGAR